MAQQEKHILRSQHLAGRSQLKEPQSPPVHSKASQASLISVSLSCCVQTWTSHCLEDFQGCHSPILEMKAAKLNSSCPHLKFFLSPVLKTLFFKPSTKDLKLFSFHLRDVAEDH